MRTANNTIARKVRAMPGIVLAGLWDSEDPVLRDIARTEGHERAEAYALDQELRKLTEAQP